MANKTAKHYKPAPSPEPALWEVYLSPHVQLIVSAEDEASARVAADEMLRPAGQEGMRSQAIAIQKVKRVSDEWHDWIE